MTPKLTPQEEFELTHRYVDGEVSSSERAALEAQAKADPGLRARVEGLLEVKKLVKDVSEGAGGELDANAMFADIEARIAAETTTSADSSVDDLKLERKRPDLRVVPGAGPRAPANVVPLEVRRRRMIGAAIGALAVAAAGVIAYRQWAEPAEVAHTEPRETVPVAPPDEEVAVGEPARTEVLEVDFGTNAGTIFAVEDDDGDRYVVVWLDDENEGTN